MESLCGGRGGERLRPPKLTARKSALNSERTCENFEFRRRRSPTTNPRPVSRLISEHMARPVPLVSDCDFSPPNRRLICKCPTLRRTYVLLINVPGQVRSWKRAGRRAVRSDRFAGRVLQLFRPQSRRLFRLFCNNSETNGYVQGQNIQHLRVPRNTVR